RNAVDVWLENVRIGGDAGHAPAVDQDQRLISAEAAQVDGALVAARAHQALPLALTRLVHGQTGFEEGLQVRRHGAPDLLRVEHHIRLYIVLGAPDVGVGAARALDQDLRDAAGIPCITTSLRGLGIGCARTAFAGRGNGILPCLLLCANQPDLLPRASLPACGRGVA